jgi:hypothetical protein
LKQHYKSLLLRACLLLSGGMTAEEAEAHASKKRHVDPEVLADIKVGSACSQV